MRAFRPGVVTLLYWVHPSASERNAVKIGEFLGKEIQLLRLTEDSVGGEGQFCNSVAADHCFIISASTLSEICDRKGLDWLRGITNSATHVFVYGFEPGRRHNLLLQTLTSGSVTGVETLPPGAARFTVEQGSRYVCRQFAGLSFEVPGLEADLAFVEGLVQSHSSSLIRIGKRPFYVSSRNQGCQWMLVACRELADLDAIVSREASPLQFFPGLVPLLMFILRVSGNEVWHNDAPRACLIVDDPLLRDHYGFLDYRKLLEAMERERFCTSMAFIPWNYRRSDPHTTALLAAHPQRYSLCVHGCDHTRGEFGVADGQLLQEKSRTAMERMRQHEKLSGLGFDDVMVFPQGIFSTAAMKALGSCGYLAAVNTTPFPVDAEKSLTLRDLLEVAVTRFSNLPLFVRRRPENLAELAFDLFLGKPALIVAHHDYFRCGYEALAELVRKLNDVEPRLQWANVATICRGAGLRMIAPSGEVHVRFNTDRFHLRNETSTAQSYVLARRLSLGGPVSVTVDGNPVNARLVHQWVSVRLSLPAGRCAEVRVQHGPPGCADSPRKRRRLYDAKVLIRRGLSEFRDNYLSKSPFLNRTASSLGNLLGRGAMEAPRQRIPSIGRRENWKENWLPEKTV